MGHLSSLVGKAEYIPEHDQMNYGDSQMSGLQELVSNTWKNTDSEKAYTVLSFE